MNDTTEVKNLGPYDNDYRSRTTGKKPIWLFKKSQCLQFLRKIMSSWTCALSEL